MIAYPVTLTPDDNGTFLVTSPDFRELTFGETVEEALLVAAARDWPHSTFLGWVERGAYDPWWGSDEMPPLPEWAGRE